MVSNVDMVRRSSALTTIGCVVCLAVLGIARPANACSCVMSGPPCEAFWHVAAVFTGRVTDIQSMTTTDAPISRLVHFDVVEAFRGVSGDTAVVGTGQGGGDCGYRFEIGETYVVYAYGDQKSRRLTTGICTRTRRLKDAAADIAYANALRTAVSSGAVVSGTVSDGDRRAPDGRGFEPLRGTAIVLSRNGATYRAVSDESGALQIGGLAPGTYDVHVEVSGDQYAEVFPRIVEVRNARGCATVHAVVRHDGRIRGRLVDTHGQPVPFVAVELWTADYITQPIERIRSESQTRTGEDGQFTFARVAPGRYIIGANARQQPSHERTEPVTADSRPVFLPGVRDAALAAVVEISLEGPVDVPMFVWPSDVRLVTIDGRALTTDGTAAAGAKIYVTGESTSSLIDDAPAIADADGRFSLSMPSGLRCGLVVEWPMPTKEKPWRWARGSTSAFTATANLPPFEVVVRPLPDRP